MQDFNNQRGLVAKVLASSVRVTLTSGPRVGQAKTFPPLNLSKVVHTGMEGAEQAGLQRSGASFVDCAASPPGDLV